METEAFPNLLNMSYYYTTKHTWNVILLFIFLKKSQQM